MQRCCQLNQVVPADIDHPRTFGAVASAGCRRDHPQLRYVAARFRLARLEVGLSVHCTGCGRAELVDEVAEPVAAYDCDGNLSRVSRGLRTRIESPDIR